MDFGSAQPNGSNNKGIPLPNRSTLLSVWDNAAVNTTAAIRPPELWADTFLNTDKPLDYRACDVWSYGCLLYSLFFAASPFESQLSSSGVRYVDTTHSSVLSEGYRRQPNNAGSVVEKRWMEYTRGWKDVVHGCLEGEREKRLDGEEVWGLIKGLERDVRGGSFGDDFI
jgi:serine/threonine protein kinase